MQEIYEQLYISTGCVWKQLLIDGMGGFEVKWGITNKVMVYVGHKVSLVNIVCNG